MTFEKEEARNKRDDEEFVMGSFRDAHKCSFVELMHFHSVGNVLYRSIYGALVASRRLQVICTRFLATDLLRGSCLSSAESGQITSASHRVAKRRTAHVKERCELRTV